MTPGSAIDQLTDTLRRKDGGTIICPYGRDQFKRDFPHVSPPAQPTDEWLEPFGVYRYNVGDKPAGDVVERGDPVEVDGTWVWPWVARDYTAQEYADILAGLKADKLQALSDEQDRRVDEMTGPERDKQMLLMKAAILLDKDRSGTLTESEEILLSTLRGAGAMVMALEAKELTIAAEIEACTTHEAVLAIDVSAAERWA